MVCLQPMPYQCRYCNHFQPDCLKSPCNLTVGKESWRNVTETYRKCKSFRPNQQHCERCSLRLECITGA
jgi:hypothetical protein